MHDVFYTCCCLYKYFFHAKFLGYVKELDFILEKPSKKLLKPLQFSLRLDSFNSHIICILTCISVLMSVDFPAVCMYSSCWTVDTV